MTEKRRYTVTFVVDVDKGDSDSEEDVEAEALQEVAWMAERQPWKARMTFEPSDCHCQE